MTSKIRGSGGNIGPTKTELDQRGVLIFHVHMRCHIFHVCYDS
jgi:hypothetical protein